MSPSSGHAPRRRWAELLELGGRHSNRTHSRRSQTSINAKQPGCHPVDDEVHAAAAINFVRAPSRQSRTCRCVIWHDAFPGAFVAPRAQRTGVRCGIGAGLHDEAGLTDGAAQGLARLAVCVGNYRWLPIASNPGPWHRRRPMRRRTVYRHPRGRFGMCISTADQQPCEQSATRTKADETRPEAGLAVHSPSGVSAITSMKRPFASKRHLKRLMPSLPLSTVPLIALLPSAARTDLSVFT